MELICAMVKNHYMVVYGLWSAIPYRHPNNWNRYINPYYWWPPLLWENTPSSQHGTVSEKQVYPESTHSGTFSRASTCAGPTLAKRGASRQIAPHQLLTPSPSQFPFPKQPSCWIFVWMVLDGHFAIRPANPPICPPINFCATSHV